MKRSLFSFIAGVLLSAFVMDGAHAQQKVGGVLGPADPNAYLQLGDAIGATGGLLLSRVALTATSSPAPLSAHVAGMTVYNTATAGSGGTAVIPGYYYDDGTKWIAMGSGSEPWHSKVTHAGAVNNTDSVYVMGKAGIGTSNPMAQLHVNGDAIVTIMPSANTTDSIVIRDAAGQLRQMSAARLQNILSPPDTVTSLNCTAATYSGGSLVIGRPASGLISIPYQGGNGGRYSSILVASTGVTGLIARAASGHSAQGAGTLILRVSGTPSGTGNCSFPISFGGQSCTVNLPTVQPVATSTLDCVGATTTGSLTAGTAASGVTINIPYTGGNGGSYTAICLASSGVSGLSASAPAGSVNFGSGTLVLSVSGTPAEGPGGTASFGITLGGQSCSVNVPVAASGAQVTSLNCGSVTTAGTLTIGAAANGVTISVPYSGGNGGGYPVLSFPSSGVTGFTATASAGAVANGNGTLVLTVNGAGNGTGSGTAIFNLLLGGQSCSVSMPVTGASITSLNCAGATQTGNLIAGTAASGVTISVPYSGGNGGSYSSMSIASTGVTGLTATAPAGALVSGNGTLTLSVSGTPSGPGTSSFAISLGGQSCTVTSSIGGAIAGNGICAGAMISASGCAGVPGATVNGGGSNGPIYDWPGAAGYMSSTSQALVEIGGQCWFRYNAISNPSVFPLDWPIPAKTTYGTPSEWGTSGGSQGGEGTGVYEPDYGFHGYWNLQPFGTSGSGTFQGWAGAEPAPGEGQLYQWSAAMNNSRTERAQGICPSGFHVPSDCEWMYLENTLGMSVVGQELGIQPGYDNSRSGGLVAAKLSTFAYGRTGNNSTGFTGLLAGGRGYGTNGDFRGRGSQTGFPAGFTGSAFWWSSTFVPRAPNPNSQPPQWMGAMMRYFSTADAYSNDSYLGNFYRGANGVGEAISVRCLRN
jgi:uncharacterized protein (TIGR02145 family)